MHMITSINMSMPDRSESDPFATGNNNNNATIGFDDFVSSEDFASPIPVGRDSPGSPTSLEMIAERVATNNSGNIITAINVSNTNCSSMIRPPSSSGGSGFANQGVTTAAPAPAITTSSAPPSSSVEDASKSFPIILHSIVSDPQSDSAIHWLPCGTRFVIASKEEFSKNILPHYFGGRSANSGGGGGASTKFTSFTRRLKRWNFSRVPSGREMGAYFHENFRRGEPELAKKIMYPVSGGKSSGGSAGGSGSGAGGGGGGGGTNKSGGKPKAVKARSTVKIPKARRRASTGSMIPNKIIKDAEAAAAAAENNSGAVDNAAGAKAFELFELDISPAPIHKSPLMGEEDILPLPLMDNDMSDMKSWLTSADFVNMADGLGEATPSATPSTTGGACAPLMDLEPPASVVSNTSSSHQASFLLPPPAFPNSVISQQMQQPSQVVGGLGMGSASGMMGLGMQSPRTMRRHSVTLGNLTSGGGVSSIPLPPMMISSTSVGNNPNYRNGGGMASNPNSLNGAPTQLLGNNFCAPVIGNTMNTSNTMNNNFGSTSLPMQMMAVKTKTGMEQPDHAGSKPGGALNDDNRSISSFSREFSFDDLKMVDPFT